MAASAVVAPAELVAELKQWQDERVAALKKPDGWLSLVGLYWLEPGSNRLVLDAAGSGDGSSAREGEALIVLPRPAGLCDAPTDLGTLIIEATSPPGQSAQAVAAGVAGSLAVPSWRARFVAAGAAAVPVRVVASGETVAGAIELNLDDEEAPTVLAAGSLHFHVIERGGEPALRVRDVESPRRDMVTVIPRFPVDPTWQVAGRFELEEQPREIAVPNATGREYPQKTVGTVVFERLGREFRLVALGADVSQSLLLVVGDQTNGGETYPGGRYIYVDVASEGRVAVDFNRLYNPPCVFSAFATCPLPPRGNRLPIRIEAGEQWVHLPDMH